MKKKKNPGFIGPISFVLFFLMAFFVSEKFGIPENYLCTENIGICAVPILGNIIEMISSPKAWVSTLYGFFGLWVVLKILKKSGYNV